MPTKRIITIAILLCFTLDVTCLDLHLSSDASFIAPLYPVPDSTSRLSRDVLIRPTSGSKTEVKYANYTAKVDIDQGGQGYLSRDVIFLSYPIVEVLFLGDSSSTGCVHLLEGTIGAHCKLFNNRCKASFRIPSHLFVQKETALQLNYSISSNGRCSRQNSRPLSDIVLKREDVRTTKMMDDIKVSLPKTINEGSNFTVHLSSKSRNTSFTFLVKVRNGVKLNGVFSGNRGAWSIDVRKLGKFHTKRQKRFKRKKLQRNSNKVNSRLNKQRKMLRWRKRRRTKVIHMVSVDRSNAPLNEQDDILYMELQSRTRKPRISLSLFKNKTDVNIKLPFSLANRITTFAIVEKSDMLNMAILNGRKQKNQLKIYTLNVRNKLTEVTSECECRSTNVYVVKVDRNCEYLYLDGTETESAHSFLIDISYKNNVVNLKVNIWLPSLPLIVKLSQNTLNPIKEWNIPGYLYQMSKDNKSHYTITDDKYSHCSRQFYQQCNVEIYAKFYVKVNGSSLFFSHPKIKLLITDAIIEENSSASMQLSHANVGRIINRNSHLVVEGIGLGKTNIQVTTRSGIVLGQSDLLTVTSDQISVNSLNIDIISGIKVIGERVEGMNGVISLNIDIISELVEFNQEAWLSISVIYGDGSSMDVSHLNPRNYKLEVQSLDEKVVKVKRTNKGQWKIISLRKGKGEFLKISLLKPESTRNVVCEKGIIAVSYAYIEINIKDNSISTVNKTKSKKKKHSPKNATLYDQRDVVNKAKKKKVPTATLR